MCILDMGGGMNPQNLPKIYFLSYIDDENDIGVSYWSIFTRNFDCNTGTLASIRCYGNQYDSFTISDHQSRHAYE